MAVEVIKEMWELKELSIPLGTGHTEILQVINSSLVSLVRYEVV